MLSRILLCFTVFLFPSLAIAQQKSAANTLTKYAATPPPIVLTFRTGFLSSIPSQKIVFDKVEAGMQISYFSAIAEAYNCQNPPTVSLYDCGADHSCADGVSIASATPLAEGVLVGGAVTASIAAGDYFAWALTGGPCSELDIKADAKKTGP